MFVDTFFGWTEVFPMKTETATVVDKKLLGDIPPRYGFPHDWVRQWASICVQSKPGRSEIYIGTDWKLHCAYRPQSSGQVERMTRTIRINQNSID